MDAVTCEALQLHETHVTAIDHRLCYSVKAEGGTLRMICDYWLHVDGDAKPSGMRNVFLLSPNHTAKKKLGATAVGLDVGPDQTVNDFDTVLATSEPLTNEIH